MVKDNFRFPKIDQDTYPLRKYFDPILKMQIAEVSSLMKELNFNKVLDAGCGDGFLTNLFCVNNNQVIGLDLEDKTPKDKKLFKFMKADARKMPFPDSSFDIVVSFDVIEHIEEDTIFLAECRRVLKRDGKLILGTPNKERISYRLLSLLGKKPVFPRCLGENPLYGKICHKREYTISELDSFVRREGFAVKKNESAWFGFFYNRVVLGFSRPPVFLRKFAHYILLEAQKK